MTEEQTVLLTVQFLSGLTLVGKGDMPPSELRSLTKEDSSWFALRYPMTLQSQSVPHPDHPGEAALVLILLPRIQSEEETHWFRTDQVFTADRAGAELQKTWTELVTQTRARRVHLAIPKGPKLLT